MVLAATCRVRGLEDRAVTEAGFLPPCSLCGRSRGKRCRFGCPEAIAEGTSGLAQFKEPKEIGYGEQQAGTEHSGFLPQHGP